MNSEKEILVWWLNQHGYFTISSVNAGKNKEINVIAIKVNGGVKEIVHFEVMVSISQTLADDISGIAKIVSRKFDDKLVQKKVKSVIAEHVGDYSEYTKTIVLGVLAKGNGKEVKKKFLSKGINVLSFDDIMFDIVKNISGVNFNNPIIRTIQLFKYILLSNPNKLALLSQNLEILNKPDQDKFMKTLLGLERAQSSLTKKITEEDLGRILRNSSLKQPERLARLIEDNVLSKRSRTRFVNELLKQDTMKEKIKEQVTEISKNQKGLNEYFK